MPIRQWSGSAWEIALEQNFLSIKAKGLDHEIPFDNTVTLDARRSWFRWQLLSNHGLQLKLKGASRYEARLIGRLFLKSVISDHFTCGDGHFSFANLE